MGGLLIEQLKVLEAFEKGDSVTFKVHNKVTSPTPPLPSHHWSWQATATRHCPACHTTCV